MNEQMCRAGLSEWFDEDEDEVNHVHSHRISLTPVFEQQVRPPPSLN